MIMKRGIASVRTIVVLSVLMLLPCTTGCGLFVNLYHAFSGGELVPARFEGLKGKRVAVVCVSTTNTYGPTSITEVLAKHLAARLSREVSKIDVVHPNEIADWIDTNDWDQINYKDVGRGVEADIVVAIDLSQTTTIEGQQLYQGRASYTVKVFDMANNGDMVYHHKEPEFMFPRSGQHSTGTTESRFRAAFVDVLAHTIAKDFYPYELAEDYGQDAKIQ
ncbi:MAG: hypothetical protein ACI9G1_004374 [Pirellulaceae bacterium]|jgi:hypothetical protein